jgi:phenylacetate-coenzyme A ligase PaaK-like adenylate-forming protein
MDNELTQTSYKDYIRHFNERVKNFIPSRDSWTPVDDALYAPDDLYRIPLDEAQQMQLAAIQFTFTHHYQNNRLYRAFCEQHGVSPDDIRTSGDLTKIPLIPDTFFKDYPHGKDFATWLGNLYTGELPHIVIRQKQPSFDQVIDAFNAAGLVVTYSSGTGGRHTFIPRDHRTFCNCQYSLAKSTLSMGSRRSFKRAETYLLSPDPRKNSIFAGKASQIMFDVVESVRVAIDQRLSLSQLNIAMGNRGGIKGRIIRYASLYKTKKIIDNVIDWLVSREKSKDYTLMSGPPYLIHLILQEIKRRGKSFHFEERGGIGTGGGWKIHERERMSSSDFRLEVQEVLGIPERYCVDAYGMVESNGWMIQCPEGHYLHAPYSYFKPMVLDSALKPAPPGEPGRFAFLDASALSYPGFILTGDQVRMLEKCPACDRPGPVLDPEVRRITGQEERGCAEEVRRMFFFDKDT